MNPHPHRCGSTATSTGLPCGNRTPVGERCRYHREKPELSSEIEAAFAAAAMQVGFVVTRDRENRERIAKLSERLRDLAKQASVSAHTEDFTLEIDQFENPDVYGYLSVSPWGFSLFVRSQMDDMFPSPETEDWNGEAIYQGKALDDWPAPWLRVVTSENRMLELVRAFAASAERQRTNGSRIQPVPVALVTPTQEVAGAAEELGFGAVATSWREAQRLLTTKPESAVREAVSLVESVCKHILDAHGEEPSDYEVGKLLKQCRRVLGLNQTSTSELLSGLTTLVNGVRSPRNTQSDAHGKGPKDAPMNAIDARLIVTAAGSACMFLMEKHRARGSV